jgi:FixJ family two-component response regulator
MGCPSTKVKMGHRDSHHLSSQSTPSHAGTIRTVVFVDNDDSIRSALRRLFESHGFAVFTYASGAELKAAWAQVPPPSNMCLVLDMRMPEQSGLELFRELKSMGFETPVIFLSGESQTQEAIHSLKEGAVDFLLKPVEYDALVTAINLAIEHAAQRNGHGQDDDMRAPFDQLTLREKEVMRLVLQGLRGQKIADSLGITLRTVKMHRSNLMNKVGAEGVTHLLALYHQAHS